MNTPVLEVTNLSKNFGGLRALNEVDLTINRQEIVALIGPNGAGKTTFFNCITGIYLPTEGTVQLHLPVRRMLPPLTSQLVSLIKDTSLVSAIAVADLTMQAQVLIADTFLAFEIWLIVAALYLALTLCVALPARWMERRYAWW